GGPGVGRVALGAEPGPEVERPRVVAAAAGVQLPAERADQLRQAALDRHVDVLVALPEVEAAAVELREHAAQPRVEAAALARCQQLRSYERLHVRPAARDVVWVEHAVDGQRRGELLDDPRGGCVEATGPRLGSGARAAAGGAAAHGGRRSTRARMRSRGPERRMKPAASAWR